MKRKILKTKKGFSMMEMLAVVAIIIFMTAVVVMKQDNNNAQAEVEAATRQIVADLRSIQNDALNGKSIDNSSPPPEKLIACRVTMTLANDAIDYDIKYWKDCSSSPTEIASLERLNIPIKKAKIGGLASAGDKDIIFSMPAGKVDVTAIAGGKIEIISAKDSSKINTICIYNSGIITEEKRALAACP